MANGDSFTAENAEELRGRKGSRATPTSDSPNRTTLGMGASEPRGIGIGSVAEVYEDGVCLSASFRLSAI